MKVLIVSHLWPRSDFPHLGIFVADQVAELAKSCHVSVVAPVDRTIRWEEISLRELLGGFERYRARSSPEFLQVSAIRPDVVSFRAGVFRQKFALSAAERLSRALDRVTLEGTDVVHAHTIFPDGLACALWLQDRKIPLLVTAHGSDVHSMAGGVKRSLGYLLKRADWLLPVSQSLGDQLIELGAQPVRIQVMPNGFPSGLFENLDDSHRDTRRLVYLGRLGSVKRVDLLIRALVYCDSGIALEIAGDGPERGRLESLAGSLHLQNRVRFLGNISRPEIPRFLSGAALMCLASEKEGWPTVIYEALACGTPVLATEVGGIPEALSSPELGTLVSVNVSPKELAAQITTSLQRTWNRQFIRQHALEYSWESLSAELVALYHRSLES